MNLYSFEKKNNKKSQLINVGQLVKAADISQTVVNRTHDDKSQDQRSTFYFSNIQKKLSLIDIFLRSNVSFLSPAFSLLSAFSDSNEKCFARCYIGNTTRQQAR